MYTNVPGGSCHVNGDAPERVDQETVVVSGWNLLALVEIAFRYALGEDFEGLAVDLERRGRWYRNNTLE